MRLEAMIYPLILAAVGIVALFYMAAMVLAVPLFWWFMS